MTEDKSLTQRVGEKLNKLRTAKHLSSLQAATGARVGYRSLRRWQSGESLPTGTSLEKLATFYGVSASWITR